MVDPHRLQQLVNRVAASAEGLPPSLCRDIADLLDVTDVTFALVGTIPRRATLCASSPDALTMDNWQFTLDEGPCLDAASTGRSVSALIDGSNQDRWPSLAAKATELGYQALAGTPLAVGGRTYGTLNLQQSGRGFGGDTLENAEEVAAALSAAIVAQLAEEAPTVVQLGAHATVHQAIGMVSAQLEVGIEEALSILRAHAWSEGRPLIRVAEEVVNREFQFDPLAPEGGE